MRLRACGLLLIAMQLVACGEDPTTQQPGTTAPVPTPTVTVTPGPSPTDDGNGALKPGKWGGENVELIVTGSGATLRFACADGAIDQRIALDGTGAFDVPGTYRVTAGPVTPDGQGDYPARYSGVLREGDHLDLQVRYFDDSGMERSGSWSAQYGDDARFTQVCALGAES